MLLLHPAAYRCVDQCWCRYLMLRTGESAADVLWVITCIQFHGAFPQRTTGLTARDALMKSHGALAKQRAILFLGTKGR